MDARLLNGRLEGLYGLRLRHARHFFDEVAVVGQSVGVVGVRTGLVDGQQVAVAVGILGGVLPEELAVSVVGVAVEAGAAHAGRAEALEGTCVDGVLALHDLLALEEEVEVLLVVVHDRSLVGEGVGTYVVGGAQLAAGQPLAGCEVAHSLAHISTLVAARRVVVVVVAAGERHGSGRCEEHELGFENLVHK